MQASDAPRRRWGYFIAVGIAALIGIAALYAAIPTLSRASNVTQSSEISTGSSLGSSTAVSSTTNTTLPPSTTTSSSTTRNSSASSTASSTTTSTSAVKSASTNASNASIDGDWLTYHGNSSRDGFSDSIANLSSLSVSWKTEVGGPVYAEPISFNDSIFVVTENDTVYSLSAATGAVQWSLQEGTAANSTVAPYACNGGAPSVTPIIGITGTPVIDSSTSTLYVVALNAGVGFTLFAVDTNTGQARWSSPIAASGFTFTPEEQRGALSLANGFIYIPFGSYSWACGSPRGWLFGISANGNGTQYNYEVPATNEADIWTPEGTSVGSSGNLYAVTGNSYYNATFQYADSVIELSPHLAVISYFSPTNWAFLGPNDLDQDTTGATILPGNMIFSIGKSGVGFLLNESDLGGIGGQLFTANVCAGGAWGSTAYAAGVVYVPCYNGLHALSIQGGANPKFISLWNSTNGWAGPAIVAAGAVWSVDITNGTLYAFNPTTGALITKMSLSSVEHFTTPSIGGGFVIVAAQETVYALDTE
jgi:polyvinyl alcohol dehydrogenase (cytochrome)